MGDEIDTECLKCGIVPTFSQYDIYPPLPGDLTNKKRPTEFICKVEKL